MKEKIIEELLRIEAIFVRPDELFTWASGIKSPMYCDNRLIISYPEVRKYITRCFVDVISDQFPGTEVIAGTATAGIPHAAWVAGQMDIPMVYVRSKKKDHGRTNMIEGKVSAGQKVVLIEDLVSTGGSSVQAVQGLQAEGVNVQAVVAIFSYQMEASAKAFGEIGIPLVTLTSYHVLVELMKKRGVTLPNSIA